MSASASNYPSAFPSEWILTDEDDRITTPNHSRSQSSSSRDDTTPTPSVRAPLEPIPTKTSSSGYLDRFPDSWTLPDSESSPPPSPPRDVDNARLRNCIQSNSDTLKSRRDWTPSARPLSRFQARTVSIGDPDALFALQEQRQRNNLSNDFLGQRRNTGDWLAGFQRLQTAKSQPIPMRQKFIVGGSDESAGTDLEIKPQNLLWLERLKRIKALKAESEGSQHDDEHSDFTADGVQSESGYGDVPHRRSTMSDSYSTYTGFSVTH